MTTSQGNTAGRSCVMYFRSAALSGEFGMKMLREKFPEDADAILAKLGVYSRGPRKGMPKGYIHWTKIVEGGFDYNARIVRKPGCIDWRVIDGQNPNGVSVSGEVGEAREQAVEAAKRAEYLVSGEDRKYIIRAMEIRASAHRNFKIDRCRQDFEYEMFRARNNIKKARLARLGMS